MQQRNAGVLSADMDKRYDAVFALGAVVSLVHILESKIIHVDDRWRQTRFFDGVRIAVDDLFFDRHQENVHLVSVISLIHHLIVEIDVLQTVRNDILRFKLDIRLQLLGLLLRHLYFFHDHRAAGDSGDNLLRFDPVFLNQATNYVDNRFAVDHHVVLNGLFRQGENPQMQNAVAAFIDGGLDHLDRARADV